MLLFFNSIGIGLDPSIMNETKSIELFKNEIKVLNRKIEWVEVIEDDPASKHLLVEKYNKKIEKLNNKIIAFKKVSDLKLKWAKEDSLGSPIK